MRDFHPKQLSAFITTPNWTPINRHHTEGIPNIVSQIIIAPPKYHPDQIFYLFYVGVHQDYGHPGNPHRTGCTTTGLDCTPTGRGRSAPHYPSQGTDPIWVGASIRYRWKAWIRENDNWSVWIRENDNWSAWMRENECLGEGGGLIKTGEICSAKTNKPKPQTSKTSFKNHWHLSKFHAQSGDILISAQDFTLRIFFSVNQVKFA